MVSYIILSAEMLYSLMGLKLMIMTLSIFNMVVMNILCDPYHKLSTVG